MRAAALFLGACAVLIAGSASAATSPTSWGKVAVPFTQYRADSEACAEQGFDPKRLHMKAVDARRFVRVSREQFDVIVADNFHPARSGSGALYTVEHFRAVRNRLAPAGVFCQWLPLHQLDLATLRSIVRSFVSAFPQATAILASNSLETPVIGLVGRADDGRFALEPLRHRLGSGGYVAHRVRGVDLDQLCKHVEGELRCGLVELGMGTWHQQCRA